MKTHVKPFKYLFFVLTLYFTLIIDGCQTAKQSIVTDYRLQIGNLESIIQSGNWLKFVSDQRAEPYTGSLNPGRMISAGKKYHILKFENRDQQLPYSLEEEDTLSLILDGRILHLTGYNISEVNEKLSAYFEIDKYDLVDIGNASSVVVVLRMQQGEMTAKFTKDNIYNYRYFAAKYVLGTEDIPPPAKPAYEQPRAFLGGGAGSGLDFWLGYYTNFLRIKPESGDYLAAGFGRKALEYSRYNYFHLKGYLWDGNFTLRNYYINAMYGLTYPSPFGNWSFELGLAYQYYFYDKNWNSKNTGTENYPTLYGLTGDSPYEGSLLAVFLQVGGLWMQLNQLRDWTVGIAIPIPWW
jgi:hypothetical protein